MGDKKTVYQLLEDVCGRFCDEYCKHSEAMNKIDDDAVTDEMIDRLCADCPLNDIL